MSLLLLRIHAAVAALSDSDGVERAAGGGAPTAFRIWKAGANPTDHGVHVFSETSARKLAAEQAVRGNLYSIDVDHLSLNKDSPPEARKAVGWHKLEVRDTKAGPELWATDVEWTEAVRAGLEKNPPEWRYFSPAYDVSKKSKEIVAYLNTALTNNPATWEVTALATASMKERCSLDIKAALAALMGDDEEKKKEARATLAKMAGGEGEEAKRASAVMAAFGEEEKPKEETPKPKEEASAATKATAAEEPKPKDDQEKKAAVAATRDLAAQVAEQGKELAILRKKDLDSERDAILATRKDLPEKLIATLRGMPIDLMMATIAGVPLPVVDPAASARVTATRGRGGEAGAETIRAARLPPAEHEDLAERFGNSGRRSVYFDRSDMVFPIIDRAEALAILARRKVSAPAARPLLAAPVTEVVREVREGGAR